MVFGSVSSSRLREMVARTPFTSFLQYKMHLQGPDRPMVTKFKMSFKSEDYIDDYFLYKSLFIFTETIFNELELYLRMLEAYKSVYFCSASLLGGNLVDGVLPMVSTESQSCGSTSKEVLAAHVLSAYRNLR